MANQPGPAPAPYEVGLLLKYPQIGIVIGIGGLVINALVFTGNIGYLMFGFFVGIVGIVANSIGITDRTSEPLPRHRKMSITGLVCSIISLIPFIALVFSSVSEGRKSRQGSACLSNAKQIGLAMRLYADDNDGRFPPTNNWQQLLRKYTVAKFVFYCPSVMDNRYSYGMNKQTASLTEPDYGTATNTAFAFDCSMPVSSAFGGREAVDFRHRMKGRQGFANIIFVDGQAKTASKRKTDLPNVITIDQVQWKP